MAKGFKDFLKGEADKHAEVKELLRKYAAQGDIIWDSIEGKYTKVPKFLESTKNTLPNPSSFYLWITHFTPRPWELIYQNLDTTPRIYVFRLKGAQCTSGYQVTDEILIKDL